MLLENLMSMTTLILKAKIKNSRQLLKESKKNKDISKKEFQLKKEKLIIEEESKLKDLKMLKKTLK